MKTSFNGRSSPPSCCPLLRPSSNLHRLPIVSLWQVPMMELSDEAPEAIHVMGWGGFGMGWMMIPGLLALLVVVGVGLWLVITLTRQSAAAPPQWSAESPRQILDRRLAAGEIDNEQYAQMVHLIGNRATQPPSG